MATLLTLPNELLALIFQSCPNIESVLRLSSVNRKLCEVWLENIDNIVQVVLDISAYQQALDLAVVECRDTGFQGEGRPPLDLLLPRLIPNAELCRAACSGYIALASEPGFITVASSPPMSILELVHHSTLLPVAYYRIRQLVASYTHKARMETLRWALAIYPPSEKHALDELMWYLAHGMAEDEHERLGMTKPSHLWTPEDLLSSALFTDEWDYAHSSIWLAVRKSDPRRDLQKDWWGQNIED